jgi:predicted small secreted protein
LALPPRLLAIVAMLAGTALVAGCGSMAGPGQPAPATGDASPSGSAAPTSPASPPLRGHKFGETVQANSGFIAATVFDYTQPAAAGAAPASAGHVWGAVDIQACAAAGSVFQVTISDAPWSVRFADGTAATPARTGDPGFPQPTYPATPKSLATGECDRAWLVFEVPDGTRPQLVRYAPQGATPVDWLVAP